MSVPNVGFIHPQLSLLTGQYELIKDCLKGQSAIKAKGRTYLPQPNPDDPSTANVARYEAYKHRAVYYNVPRRTLQGLVGQVFSRAPVIETPVALEPILEDATGSGVTLTHEARRLLGYALAYSRGGILVDYPDTGDNGASLLDIQTGKARPTLTTYSPLEIINWRTFNDGARTRLSLVVLAEAYPFSDDGFEIKTACQYRVLRLVPTQGGYRYEVTIWRSDSPQEWGGDGFPPKTVENRYDVKTTVYPKDATGEYLEDIPFLFVGSENNDSNVDNPSFTDICSLAVAHYRNSADYEESSFQMGQPTFWFSGIDENYLKNVLKGKIQLGAMGGVPLPEGGNAGVLTAPANSQPYEAMQLKEAQMVALGAKLVEQKSVQRTATEAKQDEAADTSILATCAKNVSEVVKYALKWCCVFTGDDSNDIKFELNSDFDISRLSSAERAELIAEFNAGLLSFNEVRDALHKSGIATLNNDEAKAEIEADADAKHARALKAAQAASVGINNKTNSDNEDK